MASKFGLSQVSQKKVVAARFGLVKSGCRLVKSGYRLVKSGCRFLKNVFLVCAKRYSCIRPGADAKRNTARMPGVGPAAEPSPAARRRC